MFIILFRYIYVQIIRNTMGRNTLLIILDLSMKLSHIFSHTFLIKLLCANILEIVLNSSYTLLETHFCL